jgi:5-methylcytosine-specific restriction endonuclease McrA
MAHNLKGSHWIRDERRVRIYARDGWRCVCCLEEVRRGDRRGNAQHPYRLGTLDHVVYGCNKSDNLVTACKECNVLRKELSVVEFCLAYPEPTMVLLRVRAACAKELPPRD